MKQPIVFDYLDLLSYLHDYYKFRKNQDADFSYEMWSQELEFNKSRSFIRMIVIGKRKASAAFIEAFSRLNFSSPLEEEYFQMLVKYSASSTQKEKQLFGAELIKLLRQQDDKRLSIDNDEFVSSPLLPRLMTLVTLKDVEPTLEAYSRLLNLPEAQVFNALRTLQKLGLIRAEKKADQEIWIAECSTFRVPDKSASLNLGLFHEESLKDAVKAMAKPKELRRFKSLMLVMSDEELASFSSAMDEFASSMVKQFSSDYGLKRRVFQVNLNYHVVTDDYTTDLRSKDEEQFQ